MRHVVLPALALALAACSQSSRNAEPDAGPVRGPWPLCSRGEDGQLSCLGASGASGLLDCVCGPSCTDDADCPLPPPGAEDGGACVSGLCRVRCNPSPECVERIETCDGATLECVVSGCFDEGCPDGWACVPRGTGSYCVQVFDDL